MEKFFEDLQEMGWNKTSDNIYEFQNYRVRTLKTVYRLEKLDKQGNWINIANAKPESAVCINGRMRGFVGKTK